MTATANTADLIGVLVQAEASIKSRYTRMLRSIAHRFDTDDLYQVVCIRAHRSIDRCKGETETEIYNWVMKIAANACRSALHCHQNCQNRSIKMEKLSVGVSDGEHCSIDPGDGVNLAEGAELRLQYEHALAVIDRLPPQRQKAVRLRYVEGLDYREIAIKLGVSESAARTCVSQGLESARHQMTQYSLPGFD